MRFNNIVTPVLPSLSFLYVHVLPLRVQMRVSHDDQFLFSVGLDGSLLALRLTDKDGRGLKREKDIAFAEEVLVMKTDLEEKVNALYIIRMPDALHHNMVAVTGLIKVHEMHTRVQPN